MKLLITMFLMLLSCNGFSEDLYSFALKSVNDKEFSAKNLKDKTVLFVNVATRCGYTGQLDDLEKLYKQYSQKSFLVVGIPSNDFGGQTPEGNEEVAKFCRLKYGVTFPLLEKTAVKGEGKPKLIKYLLNGEKDISWNFEKFLVDKSGKVVSRFKSSVDPLSEELKSKIESLL